MEERVRPPVSIDRAILGMAARPPAGGSQAAERPCADQPSSAL